jgi:hypothetical protein
VQLPPLELAIVPLEPLPDPLEELPVTVPLELPVLDPELEPLLVLLVLPLLEPHPPLLEPATVPLDEPEDVLLPELDDDPLPDDVLPPELDAVPLELVVPELDAVPLLEPLELVVPELDPEELLLDDPDVHCEAPSSGTIGLPPPLILLGPWFESSCTLCMISLPNCAMPWTRGSPSLTSWSVWKMTICPLPPLSRNMAP